MDIVNSAAIYADERQRRVEEANGEKCEWGEEEKVVSGKFLRLKIRIRGKVHSLQWRPRVVGGNSLTCGCCQQCTLMHRCVDAIFAQDKKRWKIHTKFLIEIQSNLRWAMGEMSFGRCDANFVRPRAILRDKYRSELCVLRVTHSPLVTGHPICVLVQLSTAVVGMKIGFFSSSSVLILLISNSSVALMHVRWYD